MNKKTIFFLLVVLAILAAVGRHILVENANRQAGSEIMGSLLFVNLPANDIVTIEINRPDDSVLLKKGEKGWIVENRFGYPADFSKITDLVRKMKETKVGRKFPATESVVKRLSLMPPGHEKAEDSEKATRMLMKNRDGAVLVDILLGGTRKRDEKSLPDSQFIMPGQGPDIYLVDQVFSSFATDAPSWLKKGPVKVAKEDVRRITCTGPDGTVRYVVERPEKGKDLVLSNPPANREVKRSAVNRLSGALSGLEIEDVSDPSTPPESLARGISPRLDYALFNGMTYRVYPGLNCSPGIPCYLRIQVDFNGPAPRAATDEGEKRTNTAKEGKGESTLRAETDELNERLKPWFFVIPQWQHEAFVTTLDGMLEEEKKDETGEK